MNSDFQNPEDSEALTESLQRFVPASASSSIDVSQLFFEAGRRAGAEETRPASHGWLVSAAAMLCAVIAAPAGYMLGRGDDQGTMVAVAPIENASDHVANPDEGRDDSGSPREETGAQNRPDGKRAVEDVEADQTTEPEQRSSEPSPDIWPSARPLVARSQFVPNTHNGLMPLHATLVTHRESDHGWLDAFGIGPASAHALPLSESDQEEPSKRLEGKPLAAVDLPELARDFGSHE